MAAPHAFLDVLANAQICDAYLAGRISIILTADLETILWSNGAGAHFMGLRSVAETIGAESGFDRLTRHQIEAGLEVDKPVRVSGIPQSESFLVNETHLAPLGKVIFLRSVKGQADDKGAVNLIQGLSDETTAAAVFDLDGNVMQASSNFDLDWFEREELMPILQQAHRERRVKKHLLQKNPSQPIGVLALSHDPAVFLLIAAKMETAEQDRQERQFCFDPTILPLQFSWRVNDQGCFEDVSNELEQAVGAQFANIIDKNFAELANDWHMDGDGTLRALFKSHNSWGGHKIDWPVEGSENRVEITFFALPIYSRAREFVGFRGFAIIDAIKTDRPHALRPGDNEIFPTGLTEQEREIFSIIGRTLQADLQAQTTEPESSVASDRVAIPFDMAALLAGFTPTRLHFSHHSAHDFMPCSAWGSHLGQQAVGLPSSEYTILQHIALAILVYRDEKILFASDHLLQLTGFPTLDSFRVHGALSLILRNWLPKNILIGAKGESLPVRSQMRAVTWLDGQAASMISFLPDMSYQLENLQQNFDEVQKKAIELSTLLNLVSDGVLVIDRQGVIHSLNDGAARIFNRSIEAIQGQNFRSLFEESEQASLEESFYRAFEADYQMVSSGGEFFVARSDEKKNLVLHVNFAPMEMDDGYYLLLRDVSDLHILSSQIKQIQRQAGQEEAQKSHRRAALSHQIRTPLTAVLGLSQLILAEKYGALNNDRYRAYLRDIVNASEHILQLLPHLDEDDQQSARESLKLDKKKLALAPILHETLAQRALQISQKRIIMRTSLAADLAPIFSDSRAARQMMLNLLVCSLSLTPAGGQIIISAQNSAPEGVLLRLRDSGVGLTIAEMKSFLEATPQLDPALIWQEWGQEDEAQAVPAFCAPEILAVTKKLAEANGARFHLRTEPGKGMLVEIIFALA